MKNECLFLIVNIITNLLLLTRQSKLTSLAKLRSKTNHQLTGKLALKSSQMQENKFENPNISACGKLCLECDESSVSFSVGCRVCKPGIYLYKMNCFQICPSGTYSDDDWQVCRECDKMCPICWGPLSNMCGNQKGVASNVVLIENEIQASFPQKDFTKENISDWKKRLKLILNNNVTFYFSFKEDEKQFRNKPIQNINSDIQNDIRTTVRTANSDVNLSPSEIYGNSKINIELPFGSFSKNNGIFIPIPSYIFNKVNYVKNHWIYIKGQWNGVSWLNSWTPLLPSFIKMNGDKNKIYYENDGYWIFNYNEGLWSWKKAETPLINPDLNNDLTDYVAQLNTIKFGKIDMNSIDIQNEIINKKIQMQKNIGLFFKKFKETNKMIFAKLKDTIQNEKFNLLSMIQSLKSKTKIYANEELILDNSKAFNDKLKINKNK